MSTSVARENIRSNVLDCHPTIYFWLQSVRRMSVLAVATELPGPRYWEIDFLALLCLNFNSMLLRDDNLTMWVNTLTVLSEASANCLIHSLSRCYITGLCGLFLCVHYSQKFMDFDQREKSVRGLNAIFGAVFALPPENGSSCSNYQANEVL